MSEVKATITFEDGAQVQIPIWNGAPQKPRRVIDMFRRLGSGRQRIQFVGAEADLSISTVKTFHETAGAAWQEATLINSKRGERFSIEYYGETFDNVILVDVQYNVSGQEVCQYTNMVEYRLTYLLDGEDEI